MSRNVNQLHPLLRYKLEKLIEECKKQGLQVGIGECFRTVEEQNALYEQGRSTPGQNRNKRKRRFFFQPAPMGYCRRPFPKCERERMGRNFF